MAHLVALHSGGGGCSGYMTRAEVMAVADGTAQAAERLAQTLRTTRGRQSRRRGTNGSLSRTTVHVKPDLLAAGGPHIGRANRNRQ
jgi:urocanate hydratase